MADRSALRTWPSGAGGAVPTVESIRDTADALVYEVRFRVAGGEAVSSLITLDPLGDSFTARPSPHVFMDWPGDLPSLRAVINQVVEHHRRRSSAAEPASAPQHGSDLAVSHSGYRVVARGDTMNAAIDAARQLLLVDGLDVPVEELRCTYDGTAFVAMTRSSLDETVVERRTTVSQVGFLRFEPAVFLEAGDTCWTWGRSLVIRDALGVVRRVQARPHRASDVR